jgi:hypothetical protein
VAKGVRLVDLVGRLTINVERVAFGHLKLATDTTTIAASRIVEFSLSLSLSLSFMFLLTSHPESL